MLALLGLSLAAVFCWACTAHLYRFAEFLPLVLYCCVAIILALPLNLLSRPSRMFFCETAQRVLLPLQEVTWSDFLLADMFTSLAKGNRDFAQAMCGAATGGRLG